MVKGTDEQLALLAHLVSARSSGADAGRDDASGCSGENHFDATASGSDLRRCWSSEPLSLVLILLIASFESLSTWRNDESGAAISG